MPAPTALLRNPDVPAEDEIIADAPQGSVSSTIATRPTDHIAEVAEDEFDFNDPLSQVTPSKAAASASSPDTSMAVDEEGRPKFAPSADTALLLRAETRKVP